MKNLQKSLGISSGSLTLFPHGKKGKYIMNFGLKLKENNGL